MFINNKLKKQINYNLQVKAMRNYFANMTLIALAILSFSAHSEPLGKEAIPEKIMDQVYKNHPNALDISAEQKKHFNQDLYEIRFIDGEEKLVKFYRANGQFFVDGAKIDTSENTNILPPAGNDNLKSTFPKYDIVDAIMIVNPNGAGEEYELVVDAEGVSWQVSMDRDGKIVTKEHD
jgi:hypothetical protein